MQFNILKPVVPFLQNSYLNLRYNLLKVLSRIQDVLVSNTCLKTGYHERVIVNFLSPSCHLLAQCPKLSKDCFIFINFHVLLVTGLSIKRYMI